MIVDSSYFRQISNPCSNCPVTAHQIPHAWPRLHPVFASGFGMGDQNLLSENLYLISCRGLGGGGWGLFCGRGFGGPWSLLICM